MKKKYRLLIIVFVILFSKFIYAQNVDTSAYRKNLTDLNLADIFFNTPLINPAYTGVVEGHNIYVKSFYDKPFFELRDNFCTPRQNSVSYDFTFGKQKYDALGIFYIDKKNGASTEEWYGINYARHINISRKQFYHNIRIGGSFVFVRHLFDWDKLRFMDNIDAKYGFVWNTGEIKFEPLRAYAKFDYGLWYHNPLFYVGMATVNVSEPDMGYWGVNKLFRQYEISSGGNIKLSESISLHPALNMNVMPVGKNNLYLISPSLLGAFNNKFYVGLTYKNLNKISFLTGATISKRFFLSAFCGIATKEELAAFGTPAFIGGNLRVNINHKK